MLKLTLFLVMLHALPVIHFSNADSDGEQWLLTTPPLVRAARGSCLVIPCSYIIPQTAPAISIYNGFWKKGTEQVIAAQSNGKDLHQDFQRRTRFLGSMDKRNCTWMLWDVRDSDAGLYFFRIEMPEYNLYSWTYQPTELQVVDPAVPSLKLMFGKSGRNMLAFCSVTHSCPEKPPTFYWSINGTTLSGSKKVDDWQWISYSILHLNPKKTTLKPRCTLNHSGIYNILYKARRSW